jgi:hypothetical protein
MHCWTLFLAPKLEIPSSIQYDVLLFQLHIWFLLMSQRLRSTFQLYCLFVCSFVCLFVCLFVFCSFVRSFVCLFVCLFVCSFVRSFVCVWRTLCCAVIWQTDLPNSMKLSHICSSFFPPLWYIKVHYLFRGFNDGKWYFEVHFSMWNLSFVCYMPPIVTFHVLLNEFQMKEKCSFIRHNSNLSTYHLTFIFLRHVSTCVDHHYTG